MLNLYIIMLLSFLTLLFNFSFFLVSMKYKKMMIEWNMMKLSSLNVKVMFMMDMKSTAFASCVLIITLSIILYSMFYMKDSKKKNTFIKLIIVFILSMMMLIYSPSMISLLMGWEGLGMSSFILIMFYQNKKSLNSSFYTMMMNRAGDIMLILSMTMMLNLSSWEFNSMMFKSSNLMMLMIMTAAFSKSAQIPFSSWLTEAMAAPTPISALVHSSTLVTAGILIFIRFESTLKYSKMNLIVMMVSIMTLLMASMNSVTEWDIKKIVALSTLSQLSMMFLTVAINMFNLAMFHMLVHATFKALIFLCASTIISSSNTQDLRKMNESLKLNPMTGMAMNVASMTLCGFPFMSSFYSKEVIMEMMNIKSMNYLLILMFYSCMMCTLFYSLKIMKFVNGMKNKKTLMTKEETSQQMCSKAILLVPSVIYGNKMNWIINLNFKIPHVSEMTKMTPMLMMLLMINLINEMFTFSKNKNFINNNKLMMINYMWFMKNLSISMKKSVLNKMFKTLVNSEEKMFSQSINSTSKMIMKMSKKNFFMIHKNSKMAMLLITLMAILMM